MAATDGRNPVQDYQIIQKELASYNPQLLKRPQIIAANKMDLPDAFDQLRQFQEVYPDLEVFSISAATRTGVDELMQRAGYLLDTLVIEEKALEEVLDDEIVYTAKGQKIKFAIEMDQEVYVVVSEELDKMVLMTNFEQYDAVKRFQRILKRAGIDAALRNQGAKNGDVIRVGDVEFDFVD